VSWRRSDVPVWRRSEALAWRRSEATGVEAHTKDVKEGVWWRVGAEEGAQWRVDVEEERASTGVGK
jgi:hypothetical protein